MELVRLLGQNVKRERLRQGLTQDVLAVEAGMRRSYLSDVERGVRNPSVHALGRLAMALMIEDFPTLGRPTSASFNGSGTAGESTGAPSRGAGTEARGRCFSAMRP